MSSADNNSIHEKARAALKVKLGKDLRFDIAHKLSYSQEALERIATDSAKHVIKQKTLYREGDQGYMYIDSAGYFKVMLKAKAGEPDEALYQRLLSRAQAQAHAVDKRMKELEQRRRTLQDEEIDWSTITLPPTEVVALSGHALDMIVIHDLSLDDLYTTALDPGHKTAFGSTRHQMDTKQGRRLVVFTAPRTDGKPGPLVITCHYQKLHHPTRQTNPTEGQAGEVTAVKKEQEAQGADAGPPASTANEAKATGVQSTKPSKHVIKECRPCRDGNDCRFRRQGTCRFTHADERCNHGKLGRCDHLCKPCPAGPECSKRPSCRLTHPGERCSHGLVDAIGCPHLIAAKQGGAKPTALKQGTAKQNTQPTQVKQTQGKENSHKPNAPVKAEKGGGSKGVKRAVGDGKEAPERSAKKLKPMVNGKREREGKVDQDAGRGDKKARTGKGGGKGEKEGRSEKGGGKLEKPNAAKPGGGKGGQGRAPAGRPKAGGVTSGAKSVKKEHENQGSNKNKNKNKNKAKKQQ